MHAENSGATRSTQKLKTVFCDKRSNAIAKCDANLFAEIELVAQALWKSVLVDTTPANVMPLFADGFQVRHHRKE